MGNCTMNHNPCPPDTSSVFRRHAVGWLVVAADRRPTAVHPRHPTLVIYPEEQNLAHRFVTEYDHWSQAIGGTERGTTPWARWRASSRYRSLVTSAKPVGCSLILGDSPG